MMSYRAIVCSLLLCCLPTAANQPRRRDWLLVRMDDRAAIRHDEQRRELTLSNGLIRRIIRHVPNAAAVAYDNLATGEILLRAVAPEADVEISGQTPNQS